MTTITTSMVRRPHRTMQLIEKLMSKKKTCQFIHPAYRALILKKQRLCRRSKRKIPTAQKLIDRAIHYSPTPCVRPFLCQNCGMSSCDLETIRHHNCGKKIGGLSEYSNWKRIVSHGYRSKAKDALAILETIPYPQLAKIQQHKSKNHEEAVDGPIEPTFNPKSLADYAYDALDKIHFSQPPDKFVVANGPHKLLKREMLVDKDDGCSPRRLGYYCFGCQKIYRPYYAFDEHLEDDDSRCTVEPLEVDITGYFPLNGNIVAPTIISSIKHSSFSCTQCHQSDFKSREQFHEHLFECARNPNFDTDEYPTPTPTLSEASSY